MTTAIQLWLLTISVILEATVFLRHIFIARDGSLPLDWIIICGVLIGLALFPVLFVLRHGTRWPRLVASFLALYPALYIYTQVAHGIRA
jgi:hypothetical protein